MPHLAAAVQYSEVFSNKGIIIMKKRGLVILIIIWSVVILSICFYSGYRVGHVDGYKAGTDDTARVALAAVDEAIYTNKAKEFTK